MISVRTAVLPGHADPAVTRNAAVVVVDVLRATSSIAVAIRGGATVVPVATLDEARATARTVEGRCVLAGERDGLRPDGFALGNSPRAFAARDIDGATIVMTTTNGTKAVDRFRSSAVLVAGALVNADAVARFVASAGRSEVWLVCAGRAAGTQLAVEDVVGCGAIARRLRAHLGTGLRLDAPTESAVASAADGLAGPSAQHLASIGAFADVAFCAHLDAVPVVPTLVGGRFESAR